MQPAEQLWPDGGRHMSAVRAALPEYLMKQRWYPGKDARPARVVLKYLVPCSLPGLEAAFAVWSISTDDRPDIDVFLPIALFHAADAGDSSSASIVKVSEDTVVGDALADDGFVRHLVKLIAGDVKAPAAVEAGHTAGSARALTADGSLSVRRSSVEQSNTSIRVGDGAMLKIIRKVGHGINPEIEIGRFLTENTPFESMAALLGWISIDGVAIAVLQAFVGNRGDGWTWILRQLERGPSAHAAIDAWIRKLGQRTAQLHVAFATPTDDLAFKVEPAVPADWQRWTDDVAKMTRRAVAALGQRHADLDATSQRIVGRLDATLLSLTDFLGRLHTAAPAVSKSRHHGDYHLGQVLVSGDADVTIVDFEGEPLRPLSERRAKHVPLRDVAGMLRSFGYAAATAAANAHLSGMDEWLANTSQAYLQSYFSEMNGGSEATDGDPMSLSLIRFFSIEKALYEVTYELANRPDWVSIPLGSLVMLLEQSSDPAW
jgi:trehalose synthase-fused probable maltokinase